MGDSPNWDGISLAPRNNEGSTPLSSTNFLYPVSKLVVCVGPTNRKGEFNSLTGYQVYGDDSGYYIGGGTSS